MIIIHVLFLNQDQKFCTNSYVDSGGKYEVKVHNHTHRTTLGPFLLIRKASPLWAHAYSRVRFPWEVESIFDRSRAFICCYFFASIFSPQNSNLTSRKDTFLNAKSYFTFTSLNYPHSRQNHFRSIPVKANDKINRVNRNGPKVVLCV